MCWGGGTRFIISCIPLPVTAESVSSGTPDSTIHVATLVTGWFKV